MGQSRNRRLAVGCVGPKAQRLAELETKINGSSINDAKRILAEQKNYLRDVLRPVDDLLGSADYKLYMTGVMLGDALEQAAQRIGQGIGAGLRRSMSSHLVCVRQFLPPLTGEGQDRGAKIHNMKPQPTFNLSVTINGNPWSGEVPVEETLLEFLRLRLRLTGTKRSCESEVCGACTVLVDGRPVSSCNYLAFEAHGRSVLTIEGVAQGDDLDPLQEAFIRNIGAQCGYCTPGQIMAAKALLMENPRPTREQIAEWLAGNICRCGAYGAIAQSILEAAEEYRKRKN